MPLSWLRVERFRCLEEVELEPDPGLNLFIGPNASGKTSLLEAVFFLGRGRSFRSRRLDSLIRQGDSDFVIAGTAGSGAAAVSLGVGGSRGGTEVRVAGSPAKSAASLAEHFPAQIIDPEIHKLLEEGPGRRRRFLDWGVFHVEPTFLQTWQRYHRALKQRNAALRSSGSAQAAAAWDRELCEPGELLGAQRDAYLEKLAVPVREVGLALLGAEVRLDHQAGWDRAGGLSAALQGSRERDLRMRSTQCGPHRGDVVVRIGDTVAKDRVSRGQQKLLAAGLALAQVLLQEQDQPGRGALLLDDPAAELDAENLGRLLGVVRELRCQLWVTSLRADIPGLPAGGRAFHVEHGTIRPA